MDGETKMEPLTAVNCTVNEILSACESMAALLHDIARAPAVAGIPYDGPREHHGQTAARWLEPRVGKRVARLAEQHVAAFRAQPDWRLALKLREIDDQGKVPGAEVPGLEDYRAELSQVVSAQLGGA